MPAEGAAPSGPPLEGLKTNRGGYTASSPPPVAPPENRDDRCPVVKRFLTLLVIVCVGLVVVAERFPAIHARVPWLPPIPFVAATQPEPGKAAEASGGSRRRRFGAEGPIPVLVAPVGYADVPVTAEVLGTVEAKNSVTIRPQVDGKLVEVDFREGQDVKRGDVIARIDPSVYKAIYDGAVAKKAPDEAQLANAQVDLVRYAKLAETQYGSHQQADTQKALVAQYQAQLAQDQASIDNAKATLDFATIRSPFDGRTGIRQVDQGNVVHASDTTGIVTVAQVKPIAAVFNLPQQWLRQVNAAMVRGELKLEARDGASGDLLDTGTLQVVDNTVDQTTGTVKMKGLVPECAGAALARPVREPAPHRRHAETCHRRALDRRAARPGRPPSSTGSTTARSRWSRSRPAARPRPTRCSSPASSHRPRWSRPGSRG